MQAKTASMLLPYLQRSIQIVGWPDCMVDYTPLTTGERDPAAAGGVPRAEVNGRLGPDVDSAVDVYGLAGNVVAVFDQVADGTGHLRRLPEAAEGHLLAELLLGFLGYVGDHVGLYEAWTDGVHGDAVARELLGCGLGEAEQPGLGCRVVSLADIAGLADEGAHVYNLATALLRHVRQDRVHGVEGAVEIYLNDLVPVVDGELAQGTVYIYTGVVYEYVDPVVLFHRLVYEALGLLRFRDVSLNGDGLPTVLGDVADHFLGWLLAPGVVDHDLGPSPRHLLRYRPAQAPAGACDHDHRLL